MLGVASEAAFLETAAAFSKWLPHTQSKNFTSILEGNSYYIRKFDEFRKRLEPLKSQLPEDLRDGLTLTFDSVLDVLRIYRNDAGHPTGKHISRNDAFINLQMFARYLQKLYTLKHFFETSPQLT